MKIPRQPSAAFTLIELLLVLALLVIIAGATAMALQGTLLGARLDQGEQRVRTAWSDARLQAISTGEQVAFTCLVGGRDFRLSTPSRPNLTASISGDSNADDSAQQLPEGVVFRSLRAAPRQSTQQSSFAAISAEEGQWSLPVVFASDGSSYDAVVVLESKTGKRSSLTLRGLTCTAITSDLVGGTQ